MEDSKPNQLTPAIWTDRPDESTIWLPEVLSQPEAPEPVPGSPSITETSEMLRVGKVGGVVSSFVIVPAPTPSASVAFVGPERTTVKPSLASTTESPMAATWIVFVVSPAAKVSVPDWAT